MTYTLSEARGFTLIELAVVLFVVSLMLAGLLGPMRQYYENRSYEENRRKMEDILDALYGFAEVEGRLPCPDCTAGSVPGCNSVATGDLNDGIEDQDASGKCQAAEGGLPWATLHVGETDSWGRRYRYRVDKDFADTFTSPPDTASFALDTDGDITIETRNAGKSKINLADKVPAVVISFGRNGYGAVRSDGTVEPAPPSQNKDEKKNSKYEKKKRKRQRTPQASDCSDDAAGKPYCEFDDMVVWISPFRLKKYLLDAGKLP